MVDYNVATRIIAISSLLVALDYPVETWEEAYELVRDEPQPNSLADVGAIVAILTEGRPRILAKLIEEDDGLLVPEALTHATLADTTPITAAETVETEVKAAPKTRARGNG
jgi:hypothetical protein